VSPPRTYASPEAFRQALEQRVRAAAGASGMGRFRQLLVFDRFLARIFEHFGERAIAKGGVVLELRLERARTTRDVDVRLTGPSDALLVELQRAGRLDLGDFLTFLVEPDQAHPTIDNDGMVYQGLRFRVQGQLAGKVYAGSFGLDVGFGDVMTAPPETIEGTDFFGFVGARRARHRVYARVVHIAEKLHAYTLPRRNENSRVKDLPDLALLAQVGPLDGAAVREALDATFGFRKTHPLPSEVPVPPTSWTPVYARMVEEDDLPWRTLPELLASVRSFLDPVLAGRRGTWSPDTWSW
jgi:hypothetical protein